MESRDGTEPEIFVLKFLSNMMYLPYPHCTILAGISVKIILNFKNLYCWKFMWTEQKSMKSNLYLARNLFWLIIHPYYHSSRLVSIKKNPVFWNCIRWLGWACSSLNIAKLFFFTLSINRLYSQQAFKCETVNKNDILTQFVAFWELSATCLFWPPCWCNIICIMADEHNIVFVVYYFFWCRQ